MQDGPTLSRLSHQRHCVPVTEPRQVPRDGLLFSRGTLIMRHHMIKLIIGRSDEGSSASVWRAEDRSRDRQQTWKNPAFIV